MRKLSLVFLTLVVVVVVAPSALAQDIPKCVDELDPCGPVINSTTAKPPAACCGPLRKVLKNELACVCNVLTNLELIQTLDLNVTAALTLPKRCGFHFDVIAHCRALAMAPAMAPAPTMHKHPHKHPHPPKHSHTPSPSPSPSLAPPMSSITSPPPSAITSPPPSSVTPPPMSSETSPPLSSVTTPPMSSDASPPMSSDITPPSSSVTSPTKGSNTGNAPSKIAQTGLVFGSLLLATLMIN